MDLVIWGAGGHALVVADLARLNGYTVRGFLDDTTPARWGTPWGRSRILPGALEDHEPGAVLVAIGNNAARLRLAARAIAAGWACPTLVHPRAIIADGVTLGPGTVVMAGAIVNPAAGIGAHVILNTACTVDHECRIGDGAHLSPGVHLAGGVTVGPAAWIGIGATVSDHRTIGAGAQIGAGAVVVRDIPPAVLAYGVPARVHRPSGRVA